MRLRRLLAALGSGVTAFFAVAVAVTELLVVVEFSAIVGLPVGALTGIGVAVAVGASYDALPRWAVLATHAAAGFAAGVGLSLAVSYANLTGLRGSVTLWVTAAMGLIAAVAALVGTLLLDRR